VEDRNFFFRSFACKEICVKYEEMRGKYRGISEKYEGMSGKYGEICGYWTWKSEARCESSYLPFSLYKGP